MANKDKNGYIPAVDILKSGLVHKDSTKELQDSDGYISMSRTKSGKEVKNKAFVKEYEEQRAKLEKLKAIADDYGLSKKDIKNTKEDIDEDERRAEEKAAKKVSKYMDPYFSALITGGVMPSDMTEFIENGGKKKKKKKKKKHKHDLEGLVIKDKKDKKDKDKDKDDKRSEEEKKKRSEVAETFKQVEKISKQNLEQIDATMELIDGRLKEITENAERMKSKDYVISNYISAKSSLISTRQKIATDIGANRKTIYEIEFKREKNASEASSNDNAMLLKMFPGLALNGKTGDIEKYLASDGKNKDSKKKKKDHHWDDYDDDLRDDALSAREKQLIDDGEIEYSGYDRNIQFENNFTVAIKKSYKDGDWIFVGLDDDGNIVDVPKSMLPKKSACHMKFDDENDSAIDLNSNRAFEVISVPRL